MYPQSVDRLYKKALLIGLSALVVVALMRTLHSKQHPVQHTIKVRSKVKSGISKDSVYPQHNN
ncbi:hypothetical protein FHS10_000191 [Mucilaginibacter dorajii]|nr:hypothetical protein [Mucilaginibacter dorajii]